MPSWRNVSWNRRSSKKTLNINMENGAHFEGEEDDSEQGNVD